MSRRALVGVAIGLCVVHGSIAALADEGLDACGAAAVNAQKLRRAGKLREARAWLEVCAQASCREDIAADCRTWRREVDQSVGSIVLHFTDERGEPVDAARARVLVDGSLVRAEDLDKPVALDPGAHVVELEGTTGEHVTRSVVLAEGERADLTLAVSRPRRRPPADDRPAVRPVPTSVFVSGGVALIGFAGFGVMAGLGYSDWKSSACDTSCSHADASRVRAKLIVADVSLGIGVVAGAIATWLYLMRHPAADPRAGGFLPYF